MNLKKNDFLPENIVDHCNTKKVRFRTKKYGQWLEEVVENY